MVDFVPSDVGEIVSLRIKEQVFEGGVSSFDKVIRNLVVESEGEKKAAI